MARRTTVVSVSLLPATVKRVDDLAKARGISRSELIAEFISNGIEEQETAVKMFTNPVLAEAFLKAFTDRAVVREIASAMTEQGVSPDQLALFTGIAADASKALGKQTAKGKVRKK